MTSLEEQYDIRCQTQSDINEHLPVLKKYAEECDTILEFGVRWIVSTYALLMGKPKLMRSVDIVYPRGDPDLCKRLAEYNSVDFDFVVQDSRKYGNDEDKWDLIFIDTLHNYDVLKEELRVHGNRANKYIIFHDTVTFGSIDQSGSGQGLNPAIDEFLEENSHWYRHEVFTNNNGLTILKRNNV